ncbi:MAG: translation initiation factor IF-3 [Lachnospiraceae bacterium]
MNDDIRVKEVRMLDENGDQMGIMGIDSAKEYAYDKGLDLVLIAPQGNPPVCRAMDYGKYRYECDKREKEAKKKQQSVEVKEIQLSCRIDTHDFETKANRAVKFLGEGNKVRVCLKFRGREMAHQEIGRDMLAKFQDACADYGSRKSRFLNTSTMFINPLNSQRISRRKNSKIIIERITWPAALPRILVAFFRYRKRQGKDESFRTPSCLVLKRRREKEIFVRVLTSATQCPLT